MIKTEQRVPVLLTHDEFCALLTGLDYTLEEAKMELSHADIDNAPFWLDEVAKYETQLDQMLTLFHFYFHTQAWEEEGDENV